jgi:hypothetical protein
VLGVNFIVVLPQQFVCGVDEERAEEVDHPMKGLEQRCADRNEDGPKHESDKNSPEQCSMLQCGRHGEKAQDDDEDEYVVERKGAFEEVAGQIFTAGGRVVFRPHDEAEGKAEKGPDNRGPGGLFQGLRAGLLVEEEIDHDQGGDDGKGQCPHSYGYIHERVFPPVVAWTIGPYLATNNDCCRLFPIRASFPALSR